MVHSILKMEKTGKIYIPKKIRRKYGKKFFVVPYKDRIVLYNIPNNPVEDLIKIGESLKDISIEEIREEIYEEAYNEIDNH